MESYTIGLDFGTTSARALLVEVQTGREVATSVFPYTRGTEGVFSDPSDGYLARQDPRDYIDALGCLVPALLKEARRAGFDPRRIIGIGVDATASTPIPVDESGACLTLDRRFSENKNACAWLWKDHTAHREAEELADAVRDRGLPYLRSYGGIYSSEWFWAKIARCARVDREVASAAAGWVEQSDFIPALLTGDAGPSTIKRNACAAGFKGMYNPSFGGYPAEEFFNRFDTSLGRIRATLPARVYAPGEKIGSLSDGMKGAWGLPGGEVAVASGMIDAHAGAVGSGIGPGRLVKMIGTSTCDLALLSTEAGIDFIPGISGVVADGIIPGYFGVESGQAAVGDILNWFVDAVVSPGAGNAKDRAHARLTEEAGRFRAGATGLLGLDWNNGNRNVLMDPRLTGLLVGQTLQTGPEELYRALIESTGFGARVITERLKDHGVAIWEIVCCGGIAEKNGLFMQIYADILDCPISVSRSGQAAALGSAVCAAVAAGAGAGGYDDFSQAVGAMTGIRETVYIPRAGEARTYDRLYGLYLRLHNVFGVKGHSDDLSGVMKELIEIREETRKL